MGYYGILRLSHDICTLVYRNEQTIVEGITKLNKIVNCNTTHTSDLISYTFGIVNTQTHMHAT